MRKVLKTAALTAAVALMTAASVYGETISGTLTSPVSSSASPININTGATDWAYYGSTASTAITKAGGPGVFSSMSGAGSLIGGDSQTYISYSGGVGGASATARREFNYGTQLSFTYTLSAASETVSVYVVGYNALADLSATLSGDSTATWSLNKALLPYSIDGNNTGALHTYGLVNLTISGTVGETLTFTITRENTSGGITGGNVGIQAASVVAGVPEPTSMTLVVVGLFCLLAYAWRKWQTCGN
jgi:hypothetical protein